MGPRECSLQFTGLHRHGSAVNAAPDAQLQFIMDGVFHIFFGGKMVRSPLDCRVSIWGRTIVLTADCFSVCVFSEKK